MAYPTTLALITALWSGPGRTKSIALWSAIGGGIAALGPLVAGALLEEFWWGSVFLVTLPVVAIALLMAILFVPGHVNEATDPVDNLGGVLSVVLVGALVLAINLRRCRTGSAGSWDYWPWQSLQRSAFSSASAEPESALRPPRRRTANLLGRRLCWDHRLRLADGCGVRESAVPAERARLLDSRGRSSDLPAIVFMILVAPRSAKLVGTRGARFTLLFGYVVLLLAFLWMLLLWKEDISYWQVALAYVFIGVGVGLAGTPASYSLTGSVPVKRAGMASGTADLQRDLGGALLTSIFGALLAAGYASAMSTAIAASPNADKVTDSTQSQLQLSFASAENLAQQNPQYASQIRPRRRRPSFKAISGRTRPGSPRLCSAPLSSSSSFRGRIGSGSCWPSTTPRTHRGRTRRPERPQPQVTLRSGYPRERPGTGRPCLGTRTPRTRRGRQALSRAGPDRGRRPACALLTHRGAAPAPHRWLHPRRRHHDRQLLRSRARDRVCVRRADLVPRRNRSSADATVHPSSGRSRGPRRAHRRRGHRPHDPSRLAARAQRRRVSRVGDRR